MGGNETPVSTYTERLLEVRREFTLYPDRVVVRARWLLKGSFEHVVDLNSLRSEVQDLIIRYRLHRYAGWTIAIGVVLFLAAYYLARGEPLGVLSHAAMGIMILGVAVMSMTFRSRRIRFARFNTRSGRPGLDIGSAGNNPAIFNEFVEQVRRQIARCSRG